MRNYDPRFHDPENMTQEERSRNLMSLYLDLYPWHGTEEARSYDYPTFESAVTDWASDDFYIQHLTAKLYKRCLK